MAYTPKLVGAAAILVLGFWLAKRLEKVVIARLKRSNFSPEITSFLGSMFGISLKVVVVLVAAGMAGFDTSALVGMVAAAGFAVGLALQGGLRNFASGILILIFKPYKVGDWIDIEGKFGKVEEIQIFNTLMISPGLKTLIIRIPTSNYRGFGKKFCGSRLLRSEMLVVSIFNNVLFSHSCGLILCFLQIAMNV